MARKMFAFALPKLRARGARKFLSVDHSDEGRLKFLAGAGFRRYLSQYEMERELGI